MERTARFLAWMFILIITVGTLWFAYSWEKGMSKITNNRTEAINLIEKEGL